MHTKLSFDSKLLGVVMLVATLIMMLALSGARAGGSNSGKTSGARPPITVDDSAWSFFDWSGLPPATNLNGPLTFSNTNFTLLKITDIHYDGDQFAVYDNGVFLGNTSVPTDDGYTIYMDCESALTDPLFSHGTFSLAPGDHSITIITIVEATGFTEGTGCIQVVSMPRLFLPMIFR